MRIAFVLSNLTYPPQEGLHQQSVLTAKVQRDLGHQVDLFAFCRDAGKIDFARLEAEMDLHFRIPPIQSRLPDVVLALLNRFIPSRLLRPRVSEMMTILKQEYDVIHFENVGACGLVRREIAGRVVLGVIDPGSLRSRRMLFSRRINGSRLQALVKFTLHWIFERSLRTIEAYIHVVSATDAEYLQRRLPRAKVVSIPVVVPLDIEARETGLPATSSCRCVVFMDLRQPHLMRSFRWFIEFVFRDVVSRGGAGELVVLGRVRSDPELDRVCSGLPVTFLGYVDDYLDVLDCAEVIITPDLVGTGIKNRVVQGMALGKAVLGTPVAFEGIPAVNGIHAIIEASPARLADAFEELCKQPELRRRIGSAGRDLVLKEFGHHSINEKWRNLYGAVIGEQWEAGQDERVESIPS